MDFLDLAGQLGISPFVGNVYTYSNIASSSYDGVALQLEKRFAGYWSGRISYSLGYARGNRSVDLFGEVFNATNRANFNNPSGDRRSGNFLVPVSLRGGGFPRQVQLRASDFSPPVHRVYDMQRPRETPLRTGDRAAFEPVAPLAPEKDRAPGYPG